MNDITALMATMKAAAEKASNDDWVKESGDGWEATCSANDQANGGFIIAHFEGPDAAENREFVQAASPANVKTLVEALEKAQRANAAQDDHINQQQDRIDTLERRNAELGKYAGELESRTVTAPQSDYFASLVAMARVSADKAMRKFPQPNYVLLKVAEEAGEVVQAGVHYAEKRMEWEQVEGEIIQLLAMLIRLVTEGDQINGVTPPAAGIQVIEGEGQ